MKISNKLILLGVIPSIMFILMTFLYIMPDIKATIYREKDLEIKNIVEGGYSIVDYYYSLSEKGVMTEKEAQEKAKEVLSKFRYGSDGYLWIDDVKGNNVMHGTNPGIVGTNRINDKDTKGTLFIKDYIEGAVRNKEKGYFSNFYFPKPNETEASAKRGYFKLFDKWGWVIATGIYIDEVERDLKFQHFILIIGLSAVILITAIITFLFSKKTIIKPLNTVINKLNDMAENGGDLTQRLSENNRDELGQLSAAVNKMIGNIRRIMKKAEEVASVVSCSTQDISASIEQSSSGVNETTGAIQNIASNADIQKSKIDDVLERINETSLATNNITLAMEEAAEISSNANKDAQDGNKVMEEISSRMQAIFASANEVYNTINDLKGDSENIQEIVSIIEDIAGQTNLLALNAAIEAARAGEQGKGFAVVADEVRKLAEQSSEAAKQISALINKVLGITDNAVMKIEENNQAVEDGIKAISSGAETFEKIGLEVNRVYSKMNQITKEAEAVKSSMKYAEVSIKDIDMSAKEMAIAMGQIASSTEEQAASFEEMSTAASSMTGSAKELGDIILQFKV